MRSLLKGILLVALALLVPVLPLVVLGLAFEERVEGWLAGNLDAGLRFALIVALLAVDVFLPIPSSAVSTYGGGILGMGPATCASWLGMTLGAVIAFGLARVCGTPLAERLAGKDDLRRMSLVADRFGPLAILLTRALPILAEACVLVLGTTGLSWRRFLVPTVVSNLVISLTYAAFGAYFQGRDALPAAVVLSVAIPLAIALLVRKRLSRLLDSGEG